MAQMCALAQSCPPYAFLLNLRATEAYDVILFLDKTTAARKNPQRSTAVGQPRRRRVRKGFL
jgi:hypothetical protein